MWTAVDQGESHAELQEYLGLGPTIDYNYVLKPV